MWTSFSSNVRIHQSVPVATSVCNIELHKHAHLIHSAIITHPSRNKLYGLTPLLPYIHPSIHPLTEPLIHPPITLPSYFPVPNPYCSPLIYPVHPSISVKHSSSHLCIHPSAHPLLPPQNAPCPYISPLKPTFMHH